MLTVYTTRVPRPPGSIDLSCLPLDELASAVEDIVIHQTSATIWFGYLDGWMLTPKEEVRIRPALRDLDCQLVTCAPLALPLAWQNEIEVIYTQDPNGAPNTHNDGGLVHNGSSTEHGPTGDGPSSDRRSDQTGKARRTPKGRV